MLTKHETYTVDEYIQMYLSPKIGMYDEIDDFIVVCSLDESLLEEFAGLADCYIKRLSLLMDNEYAEHHGVTLSMITAQERLYQLRILKSKQAGYEYTKELSMLCIASSIDLKWLEENNQYVCSNN